MATPSPEDEAETVAGQVTIRDDVATQVQTAVADPRMFGRYRCIRELGRGGGGVVWLAKDELLDISVALKLVPELVVNDTEGIVDLKKEVLRGMALTHPGIVRVFSFEQDAKSAAIVMEYVEGETLADLKIRQTSRCFDCEEVQPWLEQLCAALNYAHTEAQIAHRDLKPRNIMIGANGRLKIADFGIASSLTDAVSRISIRTDASGTPPYMSPQQVMGERPSRLDDIYSLGATVYELLTGKPPFFRGDILAQVLNEEPPPMSERRVQLGVTGKSAIPAKWERLVARCLAKEPSQRPGSVTAVLDLLISPERTAIPLSLPETPLPERTSAVKEAPLPASFIMRRQVSHLPALESGEERTRAQWPQTLVSVIVAAACAAGVIHGVRKWTGNAGANSLLKQLGTVATPDSSSTIGSQSPESPAASVNDSAQRSTPPPRGRLTTGNLDQPPVPVGPRRGPRNAPPPHPPH